LFIIINDQVNIEKKKTRVLSYIFKMNTTTGATLIDNYDDKGAAIYIAVVLIWYSTGLVFMLFFHVRARSAHNQFRFDDYETTNHATPATTSINPFADYYNIQADNTQKQILNELKDPERRQRLWKIYFSSAEQENEPHPQYYQTIATENTKIDRINRKLANIHRMTGRTESNLPGLKRLNLTRRQSDSPANTRGRLRSDLFTPTPTATATALINENPTANQSPKKRNIKFFSRFTVENVVEDK